MLDYLLPVYYTCNNMLDYLLSVHYNIISCDSLFDYLLSLYCGFDSRLSYLLSVYYSCDNMFDYLLSVYCSFDSRFSYLLSVYYSCDSPLPCSAHYPTLYTSQYCGLHHHLPLALGQAAALLHSLVCRTCRLCPEGL